MARRASSDRDPGNGVGVWALRAGVLQRVAAAALHGDGGHALEERGRAEAAIRERDTLRYVASLAAAAAHEINNPLAVVTGYAQLLANEMDAKSRGRIDEMLKAVSRIQEIVTRMKRVTRIELTDDALCLPEMLDLNRSSEPRPPGKHQQA